MLTCWAGPVTKFTRFSNTACTRRRTFIPSKIWSDRHNRTLIPLTRKEAVSPGSMVASDFKCTGSARPSEFAQNGEFLLYGAFDWRLVELYRTDDTTSGSFPRAKSAVVKFATFGLQSPRLSL